MRILSLPSSHAVTCAIALTSAAIAISACSGGGTAPPRTMNAATNSTAQSSSQPTFAQTRALAPTSAYTTQIKANSPIAYYRMNESSGPTAIDSSGHGHNGAYVAQYKLQQPALLASEPASTSVSFPAGYAMENATWTNQAVSTECWIRPTSSDLTYHPRIMSNGWTDSTGNGFMLLLDGGHATLQVGYYNIAGSMQLTAGKAYHLVGTSDIATGMTLYVNGVSVANKMPGVGGGPPPGSPQVGDSTTTYIGALKTTGGLSDYFQGDISNCAIYDHALSSSQIAQNYSVGSQAGVMSVATPTPGPSYSSVVKTNGPLAFFRMSESSGTIAIDSSGNGKDGQYNSNFALGHPALLPSDAAGTSASFPSGYATENVTWTNQAVSTECWIRPSSSDLTYHPRIMSNGWTDSTGNGFMLWLNGGNAAFQVGYHGIGGTTQLTAGKVYHVVGTSDIATGMTLYINGVSVANTMPGVGGGPPPGSPQTGDSTTTYIGALKTTGGLSDYFQGDISNCAVYDHALSAAQVASHYNAGLGQLPGATPAQTPVASGTPPAPVASSTPIAAVTPTPTPAPAPGTTTAPDIVADASTACINHGLYSNSVLPANVGEFATHGLDRTFWGGTKTRTQPVAGNPGGSWGPGFLTSWGRHQYDTYFSDASDGLGLDPFYVGPDTAAPGSPTALRISAMPLPTNVAHSLAVLSNDQYPVTASSGPFNVPTEGGSLVVNVASPNSAQNNFMVGIGYQGAPVMFIGKLTSGGATPAGNGSGGANPWTISNIHIYAGTPGTTITPGQNDEGGLRGYYFPEYISGTLDTNINQEYGYFVSRMRLPNYLPGLSPAFWTLETGGVPVGPTGLLRNELDIEEEFANSFGNALNQNEIQYNSTATAGVGVVNFAYGTPQADYHDYGVLQTPGKTSFYIDGHPTPGDINLPDWTAGSPDKELMLMFQVAAPGTFLDSSGTAKNNPWPQYVWSQWIRAYAPTSTSC